MEEGAELPPKPAEPDVRETHLHWAEKMEKGGLKWRKSRRREPFRSR